MRMPVGVYERTTGNVKGVGAALERFNGGRDVGCGRISVVSTSKPQRACHRLNLAHF